LTTFVTALVILLSLILFYAGMRVLRAIVQGSKYAPTADVMRELKLLRKEVEQIQGDYKRMEILVNSNTEAIRYVERKADNALTLRR
jgi:hypothetical protein